MSRLFSLFSKFFSPGAKFFAQQKVFQQRNQILHYFAFSSCKLNLCSGDSPSLRPQLLWSNTDSKGLISPFQFFDLILVKVCKQFYTPATFLQSLTPHWLNQLQQKIGGRLKNGNGHLKRAFLCRGPTRAILLIIYIFNIHLYILMRKK